MIVAIGDNLAYLVASALIKLDGPEIWATASEQGWCRQQHQTVLNPKEHGPARSSLDYKQAVGFLRPGNGFAAQSSRAGKDSKLVRDTRFRSDAGYHWSEIKMRRDLGPGFACNNCAGQTVLAAGRTTTGERSAEPLLPLRSRQAGLVQ